VSDPATFVPGTTWQRLTSGGVQVTPLLTVPNATYLAPSGGHDGLAGTTDSEVIYLAGTATKLDGGQQFLLWDSTSTTPAAGTSVFNPWVITGTPGRWKSANLSTAAGLVTNGVLRWDGSKFANSVQLVYNLTELSLAGRLLVSRNAAALGSLPDVDANSPLRIVGADNNLAQVWLYSAGTGPGTGLSTGIQGMLARGTMVAPTALLDGDIIGVFAGGGYGATGWKNNAAVTRLSHSGIWSDTQQGTRATIGTTAQAAAAPAVTRVDVRQGMMLTSGAGTLPTGGDPGPGSLNLFGTLQFNGVPIAGNVPATATNDNAATGNVGQLIESDLLVANQVALVSGAAKTVTSIALTAGDWDVWGTVATNPAGTTTQAAIIASISQTTNVHPVGAGKGGLAQLFAAFQAGLSVIMPTGTTRISLAAPATVFLVVTSNFATSTNNAYGYIGARRRR
jgi:hypothetical protein